jgi:hypothetical protein
MFAMGREFREENVEFGQTKLTIECIIYDCNFLNIDLPCELIKW